MQLWRMQREGIMTCLRKKAPGYKMIPPERKRVYKNNNNAPTGKLCQGKKYFLLKENVSGSKTLRGKMHHAPEQNAKGEK